jgi:predicted permease
VRRQEMAVRAALGAARYQLIRQMLVESLALSGCGAVLGLALATGGTRVVSHLERTTIPLLQDVRVDGAALGFTMVMAVLTGLAVGLLPAFQVSRLAPHSVLKDSGRGSIGGRGSWARRSIVVTQIAVVCVLLTGAGLLVRSLIRVLDVEPGFDAANLITVRVDPSNRDATLAQKNAYFDQLLREVRAVPGVDALGLTDALPLGDNFGWRTWTASPNAQKNDAQRQSPLVRMIDAGYLAAMKIPLRAGRSFSPADEASGEPVIIVNDALARALWPGQDPLGRLVHIYPEARRVVGVVGGVSYFGLERDAGIEMYLPLRQTGDYAVVDLVVRSQRPAASLMPAVRAALARVDPQLPATEFRTMEQLVDRSVFARRFVVLLILGFAGFGLMLTSLGIYAVIAFSVSQRTQEIGIRLALGASPRELQRRILMQTLKLALVGLAFGLPAAWMAARALQGLLFRVDASDPLTFAAVLAVLAAVAALAGYLPARQASRIDPMAALRT